MASIQTHPPAGVGQSRSMLPAGPPIGRSRKSAFGEARSLHDCAYPSRAALRGVSSEADNRAAVLTNCLGKAV